MFNLEKMGMTRDEVNSLPKSVKDVIFRRPEKTDLIIKLFNEYKKLTVTECIILMHVKFKYDLSANQSNILFGKLIQRGVIKKIDDNEYEFIKSDIDNDLINYEIKAKRGRKAAREDASA